MELIGILEQNLGRTAATNKLPMQQGDVVDNFADISAIQKYLEPLFPEKELSGWAKEKFDIDIDPKEMVEESSRGAQAKEAPGA